VTGKKLSPTAAAHTHDCADVRQGLCLQPQPPSLLPTPGLSSSAGGFWQSGTALNLAVPTPRGVQEPTYKAPSCLSASSAARWSIGPRASTHRPLHTAQIQRHPTARSSAPGPHATLACTQLSLPNLNQTALFRHTGMAANHSSSLGLARKPHARGKSFPDSNDSGVLKGKFPQSAHSVLTRTAGDPPHEY